MDEGLKEKIRAHNKRIMEQATKKSSDEKSEVAARPFRRVTLHIGSPNRPRVRVPRRS